MIPPPQNKKPPPKNITTIDEKHTEMMQYFERIETEIIPALLKEKKYLYPSSYKLFIWLLS
jgi:hypothetical protein